MGKNSLDDLREMQIISDDEFSERWKKLMEETKPKREIKGVESYMANSRHFLVQQVLLKTGGKGISPEDAFSMIADAHSKNDTDPNYFESRIQTDSLFRAVHGLLLFIGMDIYWEDKRLRPVIIAAVSYAAEAQINQFTEMDYFHRLLKQRRGAASTKAKAEARWKNLHTDYEVLVSEGHSKDGAIKSLAKQKDVQPDTVKKRLRKAR